MRQRTPPVKDDTHRKFIGGLPCCVCGNNIESQAAHIRYADLRWGKPYTGKGQKSSDFYCVPLCGWDHRKQHEYGDERKWWECLGIDPIPVAMALYLNTSNQEAGEQIVSACMERVAA